MTIEMCLTREIRQLQPIGRANHASQGTFRDLIFTLCELMNASSNIEFPKIVPRINRASSDPMRH